MAGLHGVGGEEYHLYCDEMSISDATLDLFG